jgi:hypothetical protein
MIKQRQQKFRPAAGSSLERTRLAEQIIDEMARRQGQRFGPYFEWALATDNFRLLFDAALVLKPAEQSADEFSRLFVDAWPQDMAALRIVPDVRDPIANPPYSKDGLWPAFLGPRKTLE